MAGAAGGAPGEDRQGDIDWNVPYYKVIRIPKLYRLRPSPVVAAPRGGGRFCLTPREPRNTLPPTIFSPFVEPFGGCGWPVREFPMSSEKELELYRTLTQSQQKYTYFLLATAAAGIAFAVRVTSDATLHWSLIPLAGAVLAWGASFASGCYYVLYTHSNLHANAALLKVQSGEHPQAGTDPRVVQAASDGIKQAIEENSKKSDAYARGQFAFLVFGAVLFIAWHVLAIILRS
jgi:hypothetical protein